jgi:hypothetical protein
MYVPVRVRVLFLIQRGLNVVLKARNTGFARQHEGRPMCKRLRRRRRGPRKNACRRSWRNAVHHGRGATVYRAEHPRSYNREQHGVDFLRYRYRTADRLRGGDTGSRHCRYEEHGRPSYLGV